MTVLFLGALALGSWLVFVKNWFRAHRDPPTQDSVTEGAAAIQPDQSKAADGTTSPVDSEDREESPNLVRAMRAFESIASVVTSYGKRDADNWCEVSFEGGVLRVTKRMMLEAGSPSGWGPGAVIIREACRVDDLDPLYVESNWEQAPGHVWVKAYTQGNKDVVQEDTTVERDSLELREQDNSISFAIWGCPRQLAGDVPEFLRELIVAFTAWKGEK